MNPRLDGQARLELPRAQRLGGGRRRGDQHRGSDRQRAHAATLACLLLAGCQQDLADLDGIFYDGDHRVVHCAVDLDDKSNISAASLDGGLDRAQRSGEVVELYAHHPGETVKLATIQHVLDGAAARGLAFVTYADLAAGATGPAVALSFDDTSVAAWHDELPVFAQYGAHVTFFVSRYWILKDDEKALIRDLAAAGHDIEPHTMNHLHAPEYVENHGLAAYVDGEVFASADLLEADGYPVSAFAYPFGARTDELDDAIHARIPVLRSVQFTYEPVESPCPH